MEHAIPALVIAAIIVVGGVILADVTRGSLETVDESWRDIEAISEERLGTELTVVSTQVTDGGATVAAVIRNEGRTSITEPARMDLIKQMMDILQRDAPAVWMTHPVGFGLYHEWLTNTKPHKMSHNTVKYLRVTPSLRVRAQAAWNKPIVWPVILLLALLLAGALPAAIQIYRQEKGK